MTVAAVPVDVVRLRARGTGDPLPLPRYMTPGAAGMDLLADIDGDVVLGPGERRLVSTGLTIAIPTGFEGQVRPRSGRAAREGLAPAELVRVKNQMKGNILLGLETSDSRMSRIAKNEIYFGRDVPLDEVAEAVDGVTNDDVLRVAGRLFPPGSLALTVLGDLKGERFDEHLLTG